MFVRLALRVGGAVVSDPLGGPSAPGVFGLSCGSGALFALSALAIESK